MNLLLREDRGGAAILTINRPDRLNALNVAFSPELAERIAAFKARRSGRTD